MQDIKAIVPAKEKWLSIAWQVNDFCNFRCSYCNQGNWGGAHRNEDEQIIENFERILDSYLEKGYKYAKLFLSGGEPTLWPLLPKIVEKFREKFSWEGNCVGINTNFTTRSVSWWDKNYHLFDDIVASYHAEFTNEEKYLENYKFLQDKISYLCCRMMMHKNKFEQCVAFSHKLKNECYNYIIEYAPVFDELRPSTEPYHYDEEWQIEFLKNTALERHTSVPIQNKHPNYAYSRMVLEDGTNLPIESNRIIVERKNFFQGWTCNIHESLHIYPHGEIRQASCGVGQIVGNILAGKFDDSKNSPVICPKTHCHCAADINITKSRP